MSRSGVRGVDPRGVTPEPAQPPRDGKATAALVLGVVAVTLAWMPFLFVAGVVCAVLAIVFGVTATRRRDRDGRGFAGAGTLMGVVALPLTLVGLWLSGIVLDVIERYENPPDYVIDIDACTVDAATSQPVLRVAGTITNVDDRSGGYRITVEAETSASAAHTSLVFIVDSLVAGEVGRFERSVEVDALGNASATCRVTDVTGPLPFGVDVG